MEAGIIKSNYCNVYGDENDACFIAMEAGIYIFNYCLAYIDENKMTLERFLGNGSSSLHKVNPFMTWLDWLQGAYKELSNYSESMYNSEM